MMQGDSYSIAIIIEDYNGNPVTTEGVQDLEVTIGNITKKYSTGEITYSTESQFWQFPITQQETFDLLPSKVKAQLRLLWQNGDVEGVDLGYVRIKESMSKEVLQIDQS